MSNREAFIVVGIDLAGSLRRPTGVCVLRGMKAQTHVAFSDEEILHSINQANPDLVPIDAPLSLPNGRKTIHDRSGEHFRDCDRELRRRGIRFFPITLGPMRMLTERGLALKSKIETMGYRTVECFPGGAQDVWGIPRQHRNLDGLRAGLKRLGVKGLADAATSDELDAVTAALVGQWFLLGRGEMLGGDGGIVMPSSGPKGAKPCLSMKPYVSNIQWKEENMAFGNLSALQLEEFRPGIMSKAEIGEDLIMVYMEISSRKEDTGHRHPFDQCGVVLEGRIEMFIGEDRKILNSSESYFIASGQHHGWKTFDEPVRVLDISPRQT